MQRRTLPACWVWATAVSTVEQKPHEGSFSQHENKHAKRLNYNWTGWLVCTVESAEEQDHWKAAHSFNLQGDSFMSWRKPKRRRVKVLSEFPLNLHTFQVTARFSLTACSAERHALVLIDQIWYHYFFCGIMCSPVNSQNAVEQLLEKVSVSSCKNDFFSVPSVCFSSLLSRPASFLLWCVSVTLESKMWVLPKECVFFFFLCSI